MAGKIHRYDCYDIRKFGSHYISTFVDVGANVGTTSIMARILFPEARVLAFEPAPDIYEQLLFFKNWFIECYNLALGDGSELSYDKRGHSGLSRFYDEDSPWWDKEAPLVKSMSLPEIFKSHRIDTSKPYIIKIDCEGGERFLLDDEEALELVRGSTQTMLELHPNFGGTKERWQEWLDMLSDTHILRMASWDRSGDAKKYVYAEVQSIESDKRPNIELISRSWHEEFTRSQLEQSEQEVSQGEARD